MTNLTNPPVLKGLERPDQKMGSVRGLGTVSSLERGIVSRAGRPLSVGLTCFLTLYSGIEGICRETLSRRRERLI